jgi:hypothetical protein
MDGWFESISLAAAPVEVTCSVLLILAGDCLERLRRLGVNRLPNLTATRLSEPEGQHCKEMLAQVMANSPTAKEFGQPTLANIVRDSDS